MLLAFYDPAELHAAREALLAVGARFERQLTATGTWVESAGRGSRFPHLFLANEGPLRALQTLQWAQRNLFPRALLSTSVVPACSAAAGSEDVLLPALCKRAAGPLRPGVGYILYQELNFHAELQEQLAKQLQEGGERVQRHALLSIEKRAFTALELQWAGEHTACAGVDHYSGDLLLAGRRLGMLTGCVKFLRGEGALDRLARWSASLAASSAASELPPKADL